MTPPALNLSRRERQIVEILYRLEEASARQVCDEMEDPPSYSAVRALLAELVRKEQVTFRHEGKRYLYRPKQARETVARKVMKGLVDNFFRGQPGEAICALLDQSKLTEDELKRIREMVEKAEAEASNG
jgi:predicted transcriptional regulator